MWELCRYRTLLWPAGSPIRVEVNRSARVATVRTWPAMASTATLSRLLRQPILLNFRVSIDAVGVVPVTATVEAAKEFPSKLLPSRLDFLSLTAALKALVLFNRRILVRRQVKVLKWPPTLWPV